MWSNIAVIPPDVLGVNVFSLLNVVDLVRLESAIVHRTKLGTALKCTTVRYICPLSMRAKEQQMRAWKWCVKRQLSTMNLSFQDEVCDGILLSKLVSLVHRSGTIKWQCAIGKANAYAHIQISRVSDRITHLQLSGWPHNPHLEIMCPQMTSLEDVHVTGDGFAHLLLLCQPVKTLVISCATTPDPALAMVLARHAPSLQLFGIILGTLHSDSYAAIASLRQLRTLYLQYHPYASATGLNASTVVAQLTAIAKGCTNLERVYIANARSAPVPSAVLLALATHCPHLQDVTLDEVRLNDQALVKLAENCPLLHTLSRACWEVTSMDAVQCARSLLVRLRELDVQCAAVGSVEENQTLAYALGHLESAEILHSHGVTAAHCELFSNLPALGNLQEFSVHCASGEQLVLDTCVARVAVSCGGRLRRLALKGMNYNPSDGTSLSVTDATLQLLAEHCPRLEYVDLTACPNVTEAAALHLIQRCAVPVTSLPKHGIALPWR